MDPARKKRLDDLLASAPPGFVEWRRSKLEDPHYQYWRDGYPELFARHFDPDAVARMIEVWRQDEDPFSERSLRRQEFAKALLAGGTVVLIDPDTEEEERRRELPSSPTGAAPLN